jgi:Ca2+-binding RTX toxin-like protein
VRGFVSGTDKLVISQAGTSSADVINVDDFVQVATTAGGPETLLGTTNNGTDGNVRGDSFFVLDSKKLYIDSNGDGQVNQLLDLMITLPGTDVVASDLQFVISSGAGNDSITGGVGNDTITSGAGNDRLDVSKGNDEITDLNSDGGTDTINLAGTEVIRTAASNLGGKAYSVTAAGLAVFAEVSEDGTSQWTYAEKVQALQADATLDAANSVVLFNDGSNGYLYYAGTATGNADDQIIKLTGGSGFKAITASGTATGGLTLTASQYLALSVSQAAFNLSSMSGSDNSVHASGATTYMLHELFGNSHNSISFGGYAGVTLDVNAAANTVEGYSLVNGGDFAFGTYAGGNSITGTDATLRYLLVPNAFTEGNGQTMTGNALADFVLGGTAADSISSDAGNDLVVSGNGNDTIDADAGDDIVYGGAGDDTVSADSGADKVYGGAGSDSVTGGAGNDTIEGGDGADTVSAGADDDTIDAGNGADSVAGDAGNDSISGGEGNDTLSGGDGADTVTGGNGSDVLGGTDGADSVSGGDAADTITGGAGADTVTGGNGADTFSFAAGVTGTPSATNFDVITDYVSGTDIITFTGGITKFATAVTAAAGTAGVTVTTGVVTFDAADDTLAEKITAVENALNAAAAGNALIFQDGADSYIFITDGIAGVGSDDVLIKLVGVTGAASDELTGVDGSIPGLG